MHYHMKRRSQKRNDPNESTVVVDCVNGEHGSDRPKRLVASTTSTAKPLYPHMMVHHNYHDHANDPIGEDFVPDDVQQPNLNRHPKVLNLSFPVKLYEMLEKVDKDGYADVISWQPHGRCFLIHKPEIFKEIMSQYFKLSKISSFQRQLNLYGFTRLTAGLDKNGYYHEYFLRGRPDLVTMIHRNKVKGTGVRPKSNPKAEPDLYKYPPVDVDAARFQGCAHSIDTWVDTQMHPDVIPDTNSLDDPQEDETTDFFDVWKPVPAFEMKYFPSMEPTSLMDMVLYGGKTPETVESCHGTHQPCSHLVDDSSCCAEVNFDRLLDEMFCRDQTLDFKDLLKLATM